MGAHFYSNDPVGSVTLVINEAGIPITRYVYKPYGELNMNLTDVDMDRNDIFYESIYKYNGHEFDYELGLYNYNARNYDQMSGRFIQTDPKFTELAGFDSYDPYSYVASNPVNFIDPTGESWLSEAVNRNKKALTAIAGAVAIFGAGPFAALMGQLGPLAAGVGNIVVGAVGAAAIGVGFLGAAAIGTASYWYGGLKNSRTNKLDWNDQEAINYGEQGMKLGALAGAAGGLAVGVFVGLTLLFGPAGTATSFKAIEILSSFFGSSGAWGVLEENIIIGGKTRLKLPFKERNLADRGLAGKMLSEYDYNADGKLDMMEYGIAWSTNGGARRSHLDFDRSGRVSNGEFGTYYYFHYMAGQGQEYDSLMVFTYGTGMNFGNWLNEGN